MLSNGSRGTLMSYTDHSMQRRLQSNVPIFFKVPPSDKRSLLLLANWHNALWLAEHHKHKLEIQLSIIASFNF